jgi:hypothetical protein
MRRDVKAIPTADEDDSVKVDSPRRFSDAADSGCFAVTKSQPATYAP